MRCATSCSGSKDRCVLTSIMMLGALFALSTSPCARVPLVSALVIIGVPLMTFAVAAPSRIGLIRELALFMRGLEATLLQVLLFAVGRRRDAYRARDVFRARVENAYAAGSDRLADAVRDDPLRLHHARRLASLATLLALLGGVGLPFMFPDVYTFGEFPQAPFVLAFDILTFGLVGRLVGERVLVRLFEASHALHDGTPSRLRATPLTIMLGAALGAVGALVVVSAGAVACAIETSWFDVVAFHEPAFWFIRKTAPHALSLGITAGALLGAGMGLAKRYLPPSRDA
jgi:hypothetical protein